MKKLPLEKIILIDDDRIINIIHKSLLASFDIAQEVHIFDKAKSALEYLMAYDIANLKSSFLILLDINMPQMDGWQFLDTLIENRLDKRLNLYICMVTSSISLDDIRRANEYSIVNQFFSKPLTLDNVIKIIQALDINTSTLY